MNKLYTMVLHETVTPKSDNFIQITRVPGGWIYTFYNHDGSSISSCFVEYHNEYQTDD